MDKTTTLGKITIGSEVGKSVSCAMCKKKGTTDEFITMQDNKGQDLYLCLDCKAKANEMLKAETANPNFLLAVVVGAAGALLGGLVWYFVAMATGKEIGYISLGLGYLIGFGVYLGSGKKRGIQLQILSAALAIVAIIVTEKFIFDSVVNDYIKNNPSEFSGITSGQTFSVSFFEPEFWQNLVSPIGLLIYAIGIFLAFRFCRPRKI